MSQRLRNTARKVTASLIVLAVSVSVTFLALHYAIPEESKQPVAQVEATEKKAVTKQPSAIVPVSYAAPIELAIDTIDVSALVKPTGLTPEGDMAIDDNPEEVAWYELGPKPGEEGSAVIAGHYGWKDGVASVFNSLNTLKQGDIISVVGEDSKILKFAVTRVALYAPNQDATDVFKSDDGKAHLNLITCQGEWNKSLDTYTQRLVVFTDFVE